MTDPHIFHDPEKKAFVLLHAWSGTKTENNDDREMETWSFIQKFRNALKSDSKKPMIDGGRTDFKTHKMNCAGDDEIVLARDANIRNEEDWFDIYDPRNSINKRRRNEK